jgi:hypothetical protein
MLGLLYFLVLKSNLPPEQLFRTRMGAAGWAWQEE